MQIQGEHLSDADKADPTVVGYLRATDEVRRLEAALSEARASADRLAAAMDTQAGPSRGRLGRIASHLGVEEQSLKNQRQRGKKRAAARPAVDARIGNEHQEHGRSLDPA